MTGAVTSFVVSAVAHQRAVLSIAWNGGESR
jgi:hypothetical protein